MAGDDSEVETEMCDSGEIRISPLSSVERLRGLVESYQGRQLHETALYWADKLVSLTSGSVPSDVEMLATSLLLTNQYHRAAHLVRSRQLHTRHLGCCYTAARSLHSAGEHEEALLLIEEAGPLINEEELKGPQDREEDCISALYFLKGQIFESLDNRQLATEAFQTALRVDVFCFEAFDALVAHQMLTAEEEKQLVSSLPFKEQRDPGLASFLYSSSLKKYSSPEEVRLPPQLELLADNSDIKICLAEQQFYNCDYHLAFKSTSEVIKSDPFHGKALPIHIAIMVELKKTNALFKLAHSLVDLYPESAVAWFAVGCYYYLTGRQDPARRFLSKSTQLDRMFGPAWLAYGHSFAVENEHDQAMAAYFKANQLMRGCHLPLLYIGLEYGLTNNQVLAETFFSQALEVAPNDPFVLHELGVTAYNNKNYESAEKYLNDALLKIESINKRSGVSGSSLSDKWESLLNNLGHTYRKLGRYPDALSFHQQALVLSPLNPSTYSAIGYVQTLSNDLTAAVESFHKALGIRREDTFSTNMLNNVIEQLMSEVAPFPGYPDHTPRFSPLKSPLNLECCEQSVDDDVEEVAGDVGGHSGRLSSTPPHSGQDTLADTSNLSIDCEMEDTTRSELDMDQTS